MKTYPAIKEAKDGVSTSSEQAARKKSLEVFRSSHTHLGADNATFQFI